MSLAKDHSAGRTLAAFLGTPAAAVAASVGLARVLPVGEEMAFTLGFYGFVPIWTGLIVFTFLARSGLGAWGRVGASAAVGLLLAWLGG